MNISVNYSNNANTFNNKNMTFTANRYDNKLSHTSFTNNLLKASENYGKATLNLNKKSNDKTPFEEYQEAFENCLKDFSKESYENALTKNAALIMTGIDPLTGESKKYTEMTKDELKSEYIDVVRKETRCQNEKEYQNYMITSTNLESYFRYKNIDVFEAIEEHPYCFSPDDTLLDQFYRISGKLKNGLNTDNLEYLQDYNNICTELEVRGLKYTPLK